MSGSKRVFKSKKKLSGGRRTYRAWKDWEVGDILIGRYTGSSEDQFDKPNWHLEVVDAQFADKKAAKNLIGQTIGLNSAGQLNKAMEKAEEGDMLQITYNGTSEIEGGKYEGKDAHLMDVEQVEEEGEESEEEEEESEESEEEEDL